MCNRGRAACQCRNLTPLRPAPPSRPPFFQALENEAQRNAEKLGTGWSKLKQNFSLTKAKAMAIAALMSAGKDDSQHKADKASLVNNMLSEQQGREPDVGSASVGYANLKERQAQARAEAEGGAGVEKSAGGVDGDGEGGGAPEAGEGAADAAGEAGPPLKLGRKESGASGAAVSGNVTPDRVQLDAVLAGKQAL